MGDSRAEMSTNKRQKMYQIWLFTPRSIMFSAKSCAFSATSELTASFASLVADPSFATRKMVASFANMIADPSLVTDPSSATSKLVASFASLIADPSLVLVDKETSPSCHLFHQTIDARIRNDPLLPPPYTYPWDPLSQPRAERH
jgi:hypothetical protein